MNWPKNLKVKEKEPLKKHTTFKIGGPAEFFIEPQDAGSLKSLLNILKRDKIPFLLIGSGSNLLIGDRGIGGAVLCLGSAYFRRISFKKNFLEAGAGATLNRVVAETKKRGLSGAEFLAGIPGTIGGALVMNAGITQQAKDQRPKTKDIGNLVRDVTVMDYNGNIKTLDKKQIKFGYRKSSLSKYIILGARLKLFKRKRQEIENKIKSYIYRRKLTQDLNHYSAGCIFGNPAGDSAGRLIDLCGLKGRRIGKAQVSFRHANFIINAGGATAKDVLGLMDMIRKKVRQKFNINLEPEIRLWK